MRRTKITSSVTASACASAGAICPIWRDPPEANSPRKRHGFRPSLLLGLPWELLHDGKGFLFQGARPTRVRRRLPRTESFDVPVVATPIRILLVTARPEDDACAYIDHRASALPLVEAMESLPGLVKIHVLSPPTLPSLRDELARARDEKKPYHVVHFDGHGVYNRTVGLGGLCFEHPEDTGKLEKRRHVTVFTQDTTEHGTGLGSLLREHRISLVGCCSGMESCFAAPEFQQRVGGMEAESAV